MKRFGPFSCQHCKKEFWKSLYALPADAKFCSNACKWKSQINRISCVCRFCENEFVGGPSRSKREYIYCSRKCYGADRHAICQENNRTKKPRIRVKKPLKPKFCRVSFIKCESCEKVFSRKGWKHNQSFCDRKCSRKSWVSNLRPSDSKSVCKGCGSDFFALTSLQKFCTKQCAKRVGKRNEKFLRRTRSASKVPVYRYEIWKRDNFICQLCFHLVDVLLKVPHPLAPTLDHVIPISKGGKHEPENVQLAHFECNWKRGNKDIAVEVGL